MGQIEQIESESCRLFWIGQTLRITDCSELELPTIQLAQRQAEALIFLGKVGVSVSEAHLRAASGAAICKHRNSMRVCLRTSMRTL